MDVCKKKRMRSQKGFGFLAGIDVTCYLEQAVGVMSMIQTVFLQVPPPSPKQRTPTVGIMI